VASEVTPKELVFVVDTSGSMSGFPIEKSKEVIKLALDGLNPRDTFNLITFAGDTHVLFPRPVPATADNVRQAQQFLLSRSGAGGTEMMKAIRAALDPSDQQDHVRIVCFLTDGYVGNEMAIIGEIRKHANARFSRSGSAARSTIFCLTRWPTKAEAKWNTLD
jgi:Ca-activated chloride channel family protein